MNKVGKKFKDRIPNFDQFIEFVLTRSTDPDDTHLDFFWRKCEMCNIDYNVIGKMETFTEDLKYIFFKVFTILFIDMTMIHFNIINFTGRYRSRY